MKVTNERSVQSLERALDILDLLGHAPAKGLSLKEICASVQLHPSTAHHLIRTMVARSYLGQDADTRRYHLGPRLIQLRAAALHRLDLHSQAESFARKLVDATGETAYVDMLRDFEVVKIASVTSPHPVRVVRPEGKALHATASGKCLMSYQPDVVIREYLATTALHRFTANTITDSGLLLAEFDQIRAEGVALDREEHVVGVGCVAAPVFDQGGVIVAAVSIDFPMYRRDVARYSEWIESVKATAAQFSEHLGFSAPAAAVHESVAAVT